MRLAYCLPRFRCEIVEWNHGENYITLFHCLQIANFSFYHCTCGVLVASPSTEPSSRARRGRGTTICPPSSASVPALIPKTRADTSTTGPPQQTLLLVIDTTKFRSPSSSSFSLIAITLPKSSL